MDRGSSAARAPQSYLQRRRGPRVPFRQPKALRRLSRPPRNVGFLAAAGGDRQSQRQRLRRAVELTFLEIAVDAAELVRYMRQTHDRAVAGLREGREGSCLHLDREDPLIAPLCDRGGGLAKRRIGGPGRPSNHMAARRSKSRVRTSQASASTNREAGR